MRYTEPPPKSMFFFYNVLVPFLSPIWVPWMLFRTWRRKEQPNWKERMGQFNLPARDPMRPRVWLHAVSVGEVIATLPILREIRAQAPQAEILLTVTTSSGHQTAREQAAGLADHLKYFPLDVLRFQMSAMQQVQPKVVAIMETELWMNHLWSAKVFDAQTLLVNGRISDRAFPRSSKIKFFYRALFKSLDRALMQTAVDAERIESLGARNVEVFGNCKFDQAAAPSVKTPDEWRTELGIDPNRPCVVVGSLRAEEFDLVAGQLTQLAQNGIQVIIAPRHLEKTADLVSALKMSAALRSKGEAVRDNLLILDSYGELSSVYSIANLAVIGGGFANLGGQNLIQPLALGIPVVCGPHMQNFRDVAQTAIKLAAAQSCPSESLAETVTNLLAHPDTLAEMGRSAQTLVQQNIGASKRYAAEIVSYL